MPNFRFAKYDEAGNAIDDPNESRAMYGSTVDTELAIGLSPVRPIQQVTSGDPCDIWRPGKVYAVGDRILPSAYLVESTFTTGFVSALGRLYQLVCVTAGLSSFTEPTWKDPATISNYSYNNGGGGVGQLDISDNTVVWRIRPIAFIDPTYTGGSNVGSQVRPYTSYAEVNALTGTAWGTVATDADNTGAGQLYAGLMVLQRAGTTITAAAPILEIRGPQNAVANDLLDYFAGFTSSADHETRRRFYGCYRRPTDVRAKAFLVGTGTTSTSSVGTVFNAGKLSVTIQDLDIVNQRPGDNGYGIYQLWQGAAYDVRTRVFRCDVHNTVAGHGFVALCFGGDSVQAGSGGLLYRDCNAYSIAGHGFFAPINWRAVNTLSFDSVANNYSVRYERCIAWDIGRNTTVQAYNHGFSSISARVILGNGINNGTAGWTLVSGTTYSRLVSGLVPQPGTVTTISDIFGITYRSELGIYPGLLRKNTSTPTTPGTGEFGVSGGTLYINLGAVLDIRTQLNLQVSRCQDIQYSNCEAYRVSSWVDGTEGFGFATDEWSVADFENCYAHHNGQAGFFVHFGENVTWRGGALNDNVRYGFYTSGSVNATVRGTNIFRNPLVGVFSAYGSFNTRVEVCNIAYSTSGVNWFANSTVPPLAYPTNLYPFSSTVAAFGNTFLHCPKPYSVFDLSSVDAVRPIRNGDLVISK